MILNKKMRDVKGGDDLVWDDDNTIHILEIKPWDRYNYRIILHHSTQGLGYAIVNGDADVKVVVEE